MGHYSTVAILGVGLIGGSIGKGLLQRDPTRRVIGIGRTESKLAAAKSDGCLNEFTTDITTGAAEADLIIVCTPVDQIVEHVKQLAASARADTLITDAGSTKQQLVEQLDNQLPQGVKFIGSHPLAGSEKTGAQNAVADLFKDRVVVITPTEKSQLKDVEGLTNFWSELNANVVTMSPAEHDQVLAVTSHLPRLVAAALAQSVKQDELPLTATGWADATRTAAGDVQMWQAIFQANRENVLQAVARFEKTLACLRTALTEQDYNQFQQLLTEAKQNRDAMGS